MAKTAVVNPRRRRKTARRRARTKHYGSARRRRRRNPSTNLSGPRRRRRRNPATVSSTYSSGGYRRRPNPRRARRRRNPEGFNGLLDQLMEVAPPAIAGVQLARAAIKLGGDFETIDGDPSGGTVLAPGIKHAIAGVLAAEFGGKMVGDVMGSAEKGKIAMHACIGFIGDLFLHKRFLRNNAMAAEHLYLGDWEPDENLNGFSNTSAIGDAQIVTDEYGRVYALNGADLAPDPQGSDLRTLNLNGFSNRSAIGSVESSFGYVPQRGY